MSKLPRFIMLCGLPASGKSTYCNKYKILKKYVIISSDSIREELGDINDQSKNTEVFQIVHNRTKEALKNGYSVIQDCTSLSRKRRISFLKELNDIPCEKICILLATPIEICKKNNAARDRKVPEHVIDRMYKNFEVPCKQEGWDYIKIDWWNYEKDGLKFNYLEDLEKWCNISHNNPHHTLSIGNHMIAALNYYKYMCQKNQKEEDILLSLAILMHDCGKIHVKSFLDKNGNPSDKARYYEHHNVGSYKCLFYLKEMFDLTDDEILYISLLINCHMRHFMAYKDSDKARERDRKLFGDDFMMSLDILHECDLAAH